MSTLNRRRFLLGISSIGATACLYPLPSLATKADKPPVIAALFSGRIDDHGFTQAGYEGFELAQQELGFTGYYIDQIPSTTAAQVAAMEALIADHQPALIIAHGAQASDAVVQVAEAHPDTLFALIQGSIGRRNVSSYDIEQEGAAWLAGAYAASRTQTGTIAHLSGIRMPNSITARNAFAAGAKHVNPEIKILSHFSGNHDDATLAYRAVHAQAKAGADIVYTMLNSARLGATRACREAGIKQIGNIRDWVALDPSVFIASAWTDVGVGVYLAAEDLMLNDFETRRIIHVGLERPDAARLIMAYGTPTELVAEIDRYRHGILQGKIVLTTPYEDDEFVV